MSGVVTTFNNAATLDACLASLAFCDERIVLDSGSTDATRRHRATPWRAHRRAAVRGLRPAEAARDRHGAATTGSCCSTPTNTSPTKGAQPSNASCARRAPTAIACRGRNGCSGAGRTRRRVANWQLRLFRKSRGRMNDVPVHAAPVRRRRATSTCDAPFRHYGEPRLADRVDKVNRYSSGLVVHKHRRGVARARRAHPAAAHARLPQALHRQALLPQRLGRLSRRAHAGVLRLPQVREGAGSHAARQRATIRRRASCRRVGA